MKINFLLLLTPSKKFHQIYVFWPVESKSDVHYCLPEPETLDNPDESKFSRFTGVSDFVATFNLKNVFSFLFSYI